MKAEGLMDDPLTRAVPEACRMCSRLGDTTVGARSTVPYPRDCLVYIVY